MVRTATNVEARKMRVNGDAAMTDAGVMAFMSTAEQPSSSQPEKGHMAAGYSYDIESDGVVIVPSGVRPTDSIDMNLQ